jgi:carbon-monoxide dehydrogenase medium subunit
MRTFDYVAAESLEQACHILAADGAETKVLAGGVALVLLMRNRLIAPRVVVDIKRIGGLETVRVIDGHLELGTLCSHSQVARSEVVQHYLPALAELERHVASPQVRNLGTLGGNLCHAEPAADPPTLLCALDASVRLQSESGVRELALSDFIIGYYETAQQPDEVLTHILVPVSEPGSGAAYVRFCSRSVGDMPLLGVAAVLKVRLGVCEDARIVMGNVDTQPFRARESEALLKGKRLTLSTLHAAAMRATTDLQPLTDVRGSAEYRLAVLPSIAEEALSRAASRALGQVGD